MKGDKLTIATQNARGLGQGLAGCMKRKELKSIFTLTTPTTDILLLQETKLPEEACLRQARYIEFRGGTSLWNEDLSRLSPEGLREEQELSCPNG